jgi:acid phosphatase (class A)
MNARVRKTCQATSSLLVLALSARLTLAASPPSPPEKRARVEFAPAVGHYSKLAAFDHNPAEPNLPLDARRWKTDPEFVERVEKLEPEFVRVPLELFELPPCPANSSKQTRAELDYLLRLQAQRTPAEGERALYFAPWGYSSSLRTDHPNFPIQQRNLFYVGRSIGSWFNPQDLPVTAEIIGRVWRDASH